MSATASLIGEGNKFLFQAGRMRTLFMRHPEWWAWFFSLVIWTLLTIKLFTVSRDVMLPGSAAYCGSIGPVHILNGLRISSRIMTAIANGLVPWIFMVAAMMFPLLNEPVRHVAFSVRPKDKGFAIGEFLIGYTTTWTVVGVLFLLLPLFLDMLVGDKTNFVNGAIKASGFFLAAALVWQPARAIRMTKCSMTMPIRIQGWQLHFDSFFYGFRMGFACLYICWIPMTALMLAHHNFILMFAVTIIIICERYLLPHTSKLPGYAWGLLALLLFAIEMWA